MNVYVNADGFGSSEDHPSQRAWDRVQHLLSEYGERYCGEGPLPEPVEDEDGNDTALTVLSDFLTDLFHVASRYGIDSEAVYERSLLHFEPERDAESVTV